MVVLVGPLAGLWSGGGWGADYEWVIALLQRTHRYESIAYNTQIQIHLQGRQIAKQKATFKRELCKKGTKN